MQKIKKYRFFLYIITFSFLFHAVIDVAKEVITGTTGEITLFKGLSIMWAGLFAYSMKALDDLWKAINDILKDFKSLKEKGYFKRNIPVNPEEISLINKIFQNKDKNELVN
jgi:hypothetical protein